MTAKIAIQVIIIAAAPRVDTWSEAKPLGYLFKN